MATNDIEMEAINTVTDEKGDHLPGSTFKVPDKKTAEGLELIGAAKRMSAKEEKTSAPPQPKQAEVIKAIEACETVEAVDELVKDEKRQPVLDAADARRKAIEKAAGGAGN